MADRRIDLEFIAKARTVQVTRRRVLQGSAVLAGGAAIGGLGWTPGALAAPARQGTPKPVGTIKIVTDTDPVGLDPALLGLETAPLGGAGTRR